MACSCKGKKNIGAVKTPIKKAPASSNGKIKTNNRIIRREIR